MKVISGAPDPGYAGMLDLRTWARREELEEYLRGLQGSSVLLGRDAQVGAAFYSVTLRWSGGNDVAYGVISEGHGLVPCALMEDPGIGLVIGLNQEVVGVEATKAQVRFRHELDALFWTFLLTPSPEVIVVIFEIGAMAIAPDGQELWRYSKDLVTDYAIVDNEVRLAFLDETPVSLDLASGAIRVGPAVG